MSDVIDFKDIKNKVREKDVDELEAYVFDLYYDVAQGKMNYAQLNDKILEYIKEHNIPEEKFIDMQKKLMERYGYSEEDLKAQMSFFKPNNDTIKTYNLKNKYGSSLTNTNTIKKLIKNDINDLTIYCEDVSVYIFSTKNIDLNDNELNDFLVSYKKQMDNKTLDVSMSENIKSFQY